MPPLIQLLKSCHSPKGDEDQPQADSPPPALAPTSHSGCDLPREPVALFLCFIRSHVERKPHHNKSPQKSMVKWVEPLISVLN